MKKLFYIIVLLCYLTCYEAYAQNDKGHLVMFWNLENFFDYKCVDTVVQKGKINSDFEFSPFGTRHWTKKKFYDKCVLVSKSIFWICDKYGRMPDIIGVAEIENGFVLRSLINSTLLKKYDYSVVHFDSQDHRGIDVGLIYRKSIFDLVESKAFKIKNSNGRFLRTRDILYVHLKEKKGEENNYKLFVNHHPSKFGGDGGTARNLAINRLKNLTDSLSGGKIIAMGDFNDTPENPVFAILKEEKPLFNMSEQLYKKGEGTIRFDGKWELIDMFFLSEECLDTSPVMEIVKIPFLMVRDNVHAGMKPFRTYIGPRYAGGVSDHCPIIIAPI